MVVLDRTECMQNQDPLYAFALEELLCRKIGQGTAPALLHMWRHPRAFVMGLRDSRLPHAPAAARWLKEQGYWTAVRNSGGAAVPLDLGVVNVSMLLPKEEGSVDHRNDFEKMYTLIQDALNKLTNEVRKGEIAGSFCPGEFDLSIGARKFCGIAQRRQQRALSVQAFVIVEGAGEDKATVARAFYDRAGEGAKQGDYPLVLPGSMASLSECLQEPISADRFAACVRESGLNCTYSLSPRDDYMPTELDILEMVARLRERYGIIE
jgi:octanoyl-[GcvH]:protein N-octanoyltransferase